MSTARVLVAAPLVAIALLAACKSGPATPEDSLRAFLTDLRTHNAKGAWAALSKESQATLLKDAEALAAAAGTTPETDPAKLLFERTELAVLREPESISVASRPGDSVLLRVSVQGGKSGTLRMAREGELWKVDLFGSLAPLEQKFAAEPQPDEAIDPEARTSTKAGD